MQDTTNQTVAAFGAPVRLNPDANGTPAWSAGALDSTVDLVERVQQGDLAAQEVLLARHMRELKPMVHHRLPMYVRSMTDTDDVVQDVLVKTVGRLPHF